MHQTAPYRARLAWLVTLLFVAPSAHAYLDPNTGSMILSAIVGIFATVTLAAKTYWYRLKGLLRRLRKQPPDGQPGPSAPGPHPGTDQRQAD